MAGLGLTGVLLVGGASRRFGSPKALAEFEGETLGERGWRILGEVCDERIAVGKEADGLDLPFPLVDDGTELRAPLAGVVAVSDVCAILPVDCPLVTPAMLLALAEACADAAVPQTGPLPGAYRKSALPVLEARLAAGELSLRDAPLEFMLVELDGSRLVNVNTPDDLRDLS